MIISKLWCTKFKAGLLPNRDGKYVLCIARIHGERVGKALPERTRDTSIGAVFLPCVHRRRSVVLIKTKPLVREDQGIEQSDFSCFFPKNLSCLSFNIRLRRKYEWKEIIWELFPQYQFEHKRENKMFCRVILRYFIGVSISGIHHKSERKSWRQSRKSKIYARD